MHFYRDFAKHFDLISTILLCSAQGYPDLAIVADLATNLAVIIAEASDVTRFCMNCSICECRRSVVNNTQVFFSTEQKGTQATTNMEGEHTFRTLRRTNRTVSFLSFSVSAQSLNNPEYATSNYGHFYG